VEVNEDMREEGKRILDGLNVAVENLEIVATVNVDHSKTCLTESGRLSWQ